MLFYGASMKRCGLQIVNEFLIFIYIIGYFGIFLTAFFFPLALDPAVFSIYLESREGSRYFVVDLGLQSYCIKEIAQECSHYEEDFFPKYVSRSVSDWEGSNDLKATLALSIISVFFVFFTLCSEHCCCKPEPFMYIVRTIVSLCFAGFSLLPLTFFQNDLSKYFFNIPHFRHYNKENYEVVVQRTHGYWMILGGAVYGLIYPFIFPIIKNVTKALESNSQINTSPSLTTINSSNSNTSKSLVSSTTHDHEINTHQTISPSSSDPDSSGLIVSKTISSFPSSFCSSSVTASSTTSTSSISLTPLSSTLSPPTLTLNSSYTTCCVCLDGKSNMALIPCGHVCLCFNCSKSFTECPICRLQIENKVQIFIV